MARTLPQYKCIEGDLLEQIQAGVYKKGDHIPPEQTLSRQYGVSRVTVRKALENLVEQGILKRTPGAGTFVEKLPLTGKLPCPVRRWRAVYAGGHPYVRRGFFRHFR